MDYNEDEDNIENTKRSSKSSLPSEQTTFNPSSEAYYSDNRVLIPESDSVSLLLLLTVYLLTYFFGFKFFYLALLIKFEYL